MFYSDILRVMKVVHDKKSSDYSERDNPFSNFEFASALSNKFSDPMDRTFATLLGIKLARLAEITKSGKEIKNESISDTLTDLTIYASLWWYWRDAKVYDDLMAAKLSEGDYNAGYIRSR